jgi:hypothetical protein
MPKKIRIIGLLRFSVLTPTYYWQRFGTLEKIAAHLFSPDRLALRFQIFESLVLPGLLAQSDPDFDLVILTAETLPAPYLDRLQALTEAVSNLHLRPVATARHYRLIREGYDAITRAGESHRVLFRLDDDDALHLNYVRRLREVAARILTLQADHQPQAIAFQRGFCLHFAEGGFDLFDTCERAPISAGTALLAPVDYPRNPYRYNHRKLAQFYPLYADSSIPAYIRTVHGDNKSTPTQRGVTRTMADTARDAALAEHFGLGAADIARLAALVRAPRFPPEPL